MPYVDLTFANDPDFIAALPYLERGHYAHNRFELRPECPTPIKARAMAIRIPCVRCSRPVQAFRERKAPSSRGWKVGHIYLSYTCELEHQTGCARSGPARAASRQIARMIDKRGGLAHAQGQLL